MHLFKASFTSNAGLESEDPSPLRIERGDGTFILSFVLYIILEYMYILISFSFIDIQVIYILYTFLNINIHIDIIYYFIRQSYYESSKIKI